MWIEEGLHIGQTSNSSQEMHIFKISDDDDDDDDDDDEIPSLIVTSENFNKAFFCAYCHFY